MATRAPHLPIDPLLPRLLEHLGLQRNATEPAQKPERRAVVLEAAPGAGKTTRVPGAILDGLRAEGVEGEVLVAEPRRLAARLAARRVATERGGEVGAEVGYSVRFEDVGGPSTRLRFVTEGVLLRRLLEHPSLPGVAAVVLDEFHERHLTTDLLLALLDRVQDRRPDLRLVVMSATLDAAPVAAYLGDCPRLTSEGRQHPVTIDHDAGVDDRPLELRVVSAVKAAVRDDDGDVLVFLPGAREIRTVAEALEDFRRERDLLVLPLHGELSLEDQAAAVTPAARRKVVLSTNVAESSVTIDGVTHVVDSGLARRASHSPWTGLPVLELAPVSQASAVQRAGRAGRTRAGKVQRLYTRGDFERRPAFERPEIERLDLTDGWLMLLAAGAADDLRWLTEPPESARDAATTLLRRLGAIDDGGITAVGRQLARLPTHPRLGRLLLAGAASGVLEEAAFVAALLGERDPRRSDRGRDRPTDASGPSDLLELHELFEEARARRFGGNAVRSLGLDGRPLQAIDRARRQLLRAVPRRDVGTRPGDDNGEDDALARAVLAAFPDRVARRRKPRSRELILAGGTTAALSEASVVHEAAFLVAVNVEERKGAAGRRGGAIVRLASAVDPEWIFEDFPDDIATTDQLVFDKDHQRVEQVSALTFGSVVLDETRQAAAPSPEAGAVLLRAARAAGPGAIGRDRLDAVIARLACLATALPDLAFPDLGDDPVDAALALACETVTSLDELRSADLPALVTARLSREQQAALRDETPDVIVLPGGRRCRVHYELSKPPWVASRLQDFFGMTATPRVARGRVPVTLHLLAPNQRAVQVTNDLEGFWERHYGEVRKELRRRYPKHAWPEDGRTATPPAPRPPRR